MTGANQGDMVLLADCGQIGEVLESSHGRILVRLPMLDAVVMVREDRVSLAGGEVRELLRESLQDQLEAQQHEVEAYLQALDAFAPDADAKAARPGAEHCIFTAA